MCCVWLWGLGGGSPDSGDLEARKGDDLKGKWGKTEKGRSYKNKVG